MTKEDREMLREIAETTHDQYTALAESSAKTREDVAALKAQVAICVSGIDRLRRTIEEGNGFQARIVRLDTEVAAAAGALNACQARSRRLWRWLATTIVALATPVVGYLALQIIRLITTK